MLNVKNVKHVKHVKNVKCQISRVHKFNKWRRFAITLLEARVIAAKVALSVKVNPIVQAQSAMQDAAVAIAASKSSRRTLASKPVRKKGDL